MQLRLWLWESWDQVLVDVLVVTPWAEVGIGVVKALARSKHGGDRLVVDRSLG